MKRVTLLPHGNDWTEIQRDAVNSDLSDLEQRLSGIRGMAQNLPVPTRLLRMGRQRRVAMGR